MSTVGKGVENGRGFTRGSFNGTHIGDMKQCKLILLCSDLPLKVHGVWVGVI